LVGWLAVWLVGSDTICQSKLSGVGLVGWLVSWLVVWFGSDLAGWCVLTQSVDPSQVEAGWVGWLAVWLAGWLVGWFGSDTLGKRGPSPVVAESGHLSIRAKLTHVGLVGWLVGRLVGRLVRSGTRLVVCSDTICQSE